MCIQETVLQQVNELNGDPSIDGILVQVTISTLTCNIYDLFVSRRRSLCAVTFVSFLRAAPTASATRPARNH